MIEAVKNVDEFKALVSEVEASNNYKKPIAFGIAKVDRGQKNAERYYRQISQ